MMTPASYGSDYSHEGIQIYESLDDLPEYATNILADAEEHSPFLSDTWFRNFASNIPGRGESLRLFTLKPQLSDGIPGVVLPMWVTKPAMPMVPIRSIRTLSNYYSALFAPLTDFKNPNSATAVKQLIQSAFPLLAPWDVIEFNPLEPEASSYQSLREGFQQAGWATQDYFCFGNWHLPADGLDYETYLATRPGNLRNTLQRKRRRFLREPNTRLEIVSGSQGFESALSAFQRVYSQSWKPAETFPRFIPELARSCSNRGWARLGVAWLEERPIAAQFWIVANKTAYIYKLAYDPSFEHFSPGSLLTAALIEHVLRVDQVNEVDYLSGDDPYKKEWMTHRRERWGLLAFNIRRPMGAVLALRHIAGRRMKRLFSSAS